MAKRIANSSCAQAIANLQEFQGSNLRGEFCLGKYEIYSYWTLMATIEPSTGEVWVNDKKYSQTTSKQMRYVKDGINRLNLTPKETFVRS
jgi:hypothetical protein